MVRVQQRETETETATEEPDRESTEKKGEGGSRMQDAGCRMGLGRNERRSFWGLADAANGEPLPPDTSAPFC